MPLPKHTVLLVEDNRVHREVACAVLENHGMHVVQARNGEEALVLLQQHSFALVLMDIEMPWMNGIRTAQAMRLLKEEGKVEDIPIIALTADLREETHRDCIEAGMCDVIPKHIWKPKWNALISEKIETWLQAGQTP